ncbi:MAG: T9SS type A sorting domain-containing protein [Melioribacteraceae bacterium]|nr:T9SS type A sorting domain-containing protein [Melioribacteraceae bacterium]MCF8263136.1 T9SS type A sorting domain-containing protein [Melioribacteraceae bacterium]MCF8430366.1 T9SS type A sorting domain-containing protein [Melioribacteraceae bacterium]
MYFNKSFHPSKLLFIVLLFSSLSVKGQVGDIFISSFESDNTGNINNQGNWSVGSAKVSVTENSDYVHSGSKGLMFLAQNEKLNATNIQFGASQKGVSGIVYIDMYVKISSMSTKDFAISGYDLFGGGSEKRTFVFEFDTPSGSGGKFQIYNGSSKENVGNYTLGEWNRISAKIDYENSVYQTIFNESEVVSAGFRENYTPTANGTRPANVKEYHELRFNLGYDEAIGSLNAAMDDIYVSTNPISNVSFPGIEINYTVDIEQPNIGSISIEPKLSEYPDSTEVTVSLSIPDGYKNEGWTGDLSGTELVKTFFVHQNMEFSAVVSVDENNPTVEYTVTIIQPDFGTISLNPPGGVYYNYTNVEAILDLPAEYVNKGWTGDLSGTELKKSFVVFGNMTIGADVAFDTTPPTIYPVSSGSELKNVCKGNNLKPGDIVEVADGIFDSGNITIESSGTANKPIIIRAKNIGATELHGESAFTFRKNEHVVLEGFKFTSNVYTVIKLEACNNIRITRNVFKLTETEGESGKWLYIGGYWDDATLRSFENRVDHNVFRDKHQLGNFITIDGGNNVSQHDRIDHNYFYNIGPRHENEMEAIRVGWSELSLTDGFTVIEYNLFEECDGDPEIISIKSGKDTVRYNTIRRSQGTVSLRHGDGSVIHDNFFLGEGKTGTGGIRVYARNHKIYNNYFEGLTGDKWDAAITLGNGDTETGSLSAHWRIDNVIVSHNTLVNNFANIEIGYGRSDNSWKKEPKNVTLANNLVVGGKANLIKIFNTPANFTWEGNLMFPQNGFAVGMTASESEIMVVDPLLTFEDSLWILSPTSPAIDAATSNNSVIADDIQGQLRTGISDIGADEFSSAKIKRKPLYSYNVGPFANDDVVSVNEKSQAARSFLLLRNYPNPFNPSTTIEYTLDKSSNVKLSIYTLLGEKITSLLDRFQTAGTYQIKWNAKDFPTGIYIAVLEGEGIYKNLKLLLVK